MLNGRERELEVQLYQCERALFCACNDLEQERQYSARLRAQLRHIEQTAEHLADAKDRMERELNDAREFIAAMTKAAA